MVKTSDTLGFVCEFREFQKILEFCKEVFEFLENLSSFDKKSTELRGKHWIIVIGGQRGGSAYNDPPSLSQTPL